MPTISIRCLGSFGRFGNQLFQYAFARGYAESVGATLETPIWIGHSLFGLNDPPISKVLPSLGLDEHPNGRVDVDLYGYFQRAEFYRYYTLTKLREWFKFYPFWHEEFPRPSTFNMAIHLRRGDYLTTFQNIFCTIDIQAYIQAIKEAGFDPAKRIEVREDFPSVYPLPGYEFLRDFFALYNANILFRANSTFSWWAATLSNNEVYSPIVEGLQGYQNQVKFVRGNWPRCVSMDSVHDYHIAP